MILGLDMNFDLQQKLKFKLCVENLFLDQEPNQLGNKSNRGSKIESAAVFSPGKYSKSEISGKDSWYVEFSCFR